MPLSPALLKLSITFLSEVSSILSQSDSDVENFFYGQFSIWKKSFSASAAARRPNWFDPSMKKWKLETELELRQLSPETYN